MDDLGRAAAHKLDPANGPGGGPAAHHGDVAGLPAGMPVFEIQARLSPGGLRRTGRLSLWREADRPDGVLPIAAWLRREAAPAEVLQAQAAPGALRQGVCLTEGPEGPEVRFFRHLRTERSATPHHEVWRWRAGGAAARREHRFAFLPSLADGLSVSGLVPRWAAQAVEALLRTVDATAVSGAWLRHAADGAVDRLELVLPTLPELGTTPGLQDLPAIFGLGGEDAAWLRCLPVRHLVLHPGEATPRASLRLGAALPGLPATEAEAREAVIAAAREDRQGIARLMEGLDPPKPAGPAAVLDTFYSGDVPAWRTVLGEGLHYHHGLFGDAPPHDPTDAEMLAAVRRTVEELYPFIAPGSRVYDLGCGWGGPLAMLAGERGCDATGVTAARGQFEHVARMGLSVRHGDAEHTLPPGAFDSVLMMESLEHIHDKLGLLRRLRPFARQLVILSNCQDLAPPGLRFAGTMPMVSSTTLRALLTEAGWTIRHWRDRRAEAMPSAAFWRRRLRQLPPGGDPHFDVLRGWCDRVVTLGGFWGNCNPLIEVVVD